MKYTRFRMIITILQMKHSLKLSIAKLIYTISFRGHISDEDENQVNNYLNAV